MTYYVECKYQNSSYELNFIKKGFYETGNNAQELFKVLKRILHR